MNNYGDAEMPKPEMAGLPEQPSTSSNGFISNVKALSFIHVTEPSESRESRNRKVVRSHVLRDYHRNKRIAYVREHAAAQKLATDAQHHAKTFPRRHEQLGVVDPAELLQPRPALPYLDNLIPYSYLANGGPVLYVKPSSWPFSRPFSLPGAAPQESFGKSVFPRQSIWMPNAYIPDMPVISGPLIVGDMLSWISHTPECFKYRLDIIKWIQQQLKNPGAAIDDATIGAIMSLTMWENGDGSSSDLKTHMDGLEKIVSLKGGIAKFQNDRAMNAKVVLLDYILAISCAQDPRFPQSDLKSLQFVPEYIPQDGTIGGSPLFGNGDFSNITCPSDQDKIICLLETMWALTSHALDKDPHNQTLKSPSTLHSADNTNQGSFRDSIVSEDLTKSHVLSALHSTAQIYQRALSSPPTPFRSRRNYSDLQHLYSSLNGSAFDSFWFRYPGVRLWVLLVGCAACVDRAERGYFMMFIARAEIFANSRRFLEAQYAIRRFVEVQRLGRS